MSNYQNDDSFYDSHMRARSQTWPCRPKEERFPPDNISGNTSEQENSVTTTLTEETGTASTTVTKKGTARRNAWGNLSYADLITKAITDSPDKRLTLSQIYDWMIQNVSFFKDKGESNSSAGWKNSIRHNLSLHSRFMRTQNEGTGKSSWWIINPDAKPGKSPRRRSASMETTKILEKKRRTAKKRADMLRSPFSPDNMDIMTGMLPGNHSPPVPFRQSLTDIRDRTNSDASTSSLPPSNVSPPIITQTPDSLRQPNYYTKDAYQQDTSRLADCLAEILIDHQGQGIGFDPLSNFSNVDYQYMPNEFPTVPERGPVTNIGLDGYLKMKPNAEPSILRQALDANKAILREDQHKQPQLQPTPSSEMIPFSNDDDLDMVDTPISEFGVDVHEIIHHEMNLNDDPGFDFGFFGVPQNPHQTLPPQTLGAQNS